MKRTNIFLGIGVFVVVFLFALTACGGGDSDSASGSSGDKGSGNDVPYQVEAAVIDQLSLDPSVGAKIYSIKGRLDRETAGVEFWDVEVEFRVCEQCNKQVVDTMVTVE